MYRELTSCPAVTPLVPAPVTEEPPEVRLGRLIKDARIRRSKRLADVREETGVSMTALSNLENGRRRLAPARLALVVEAVGADPTEAFSLAGQAPPQATADLIGPELRRALRGGALTSEARRALRREHLVALASEAVAGVGARGTLIPIDRLLFETLEVDLQAADGWHLLNARTIQHPRGMKDPVQTTDGRVRLAHLGAHVMLAAEEGVAPVCPGGPTLEEEADFLAGALLLPRPQLVEQLPYLVQPYDLADPEQVGAFVGELGDVFQVPAWMAAEQLATSGGLAWAARGRHR
jgi:transcriptional regulator with XRE-family HTH domain